MIVQEVQAQTEVLEVVPGQTQIVVKSLNYLRIQLDLKNCKFLFQNIVL